VSAVLVAAGAIVVPAAGAAAGGPAGPAWSIQPTDVPTLPTGQSDGVSCVSASWCAAVGYFYDGRRAGQALAQVWDGTSWTIEPLALPSGATGATLTGVSCLSPTWCMAVGWENLSSAGSGPLAERWNGTRWGPVPMPDARSGEVALEGVSCTSASACAAVGWYTSGEFSTAAFGERWNGTAWSIPTLRQPAGTSWSLNGVSCTAAASCLAVGGYTSSSGVYGTLAERWDGSNWSPLASPDGADVSSTSFAAISCRTASQCIAVGNDVPYGSSGGRRSFSAAWNGSRWSAAPAPGSGLNGVSCAAPARCEAVGAGGVAASWNGTGWSGQRTVPFLANPWLAAVSCSSATACTAGGQYTDATGGVIALAERWNGGGWSLQAARDEWDAGGLHSATVSCATASACAASAQWDGADPAYTSEIWSGTRWSLVRPPNPPGAFEAFLEGVSCETATSCTGVGVAYPTGTAASLLDTWNGAGWTRRPTTAVAGELAGVSCASVSFCAGVGQADWTGSTQPAMAATWNGTSLSRVPLPLPAGSISSRLSTVSCASTAACVAVGWSDNTLFSERWNGSRWLLGPAPQLATAGGTVLSSVSCTSATFCVAVGSHLDPLEQPIALVERWNGTAWSTMLSPATPDPTSEFTGVSCAGPSACVAVGAEQDGAGHQLALAESWDGSAWSLDAVPVPAGATGGELDSVSCLTGGVCTAFGTYATAAAYGMPLAERVTIP
jgi:hypothetical protein